LTPGLLFSGEQFQSILKTTTPFQKAMIRPRANPKTYKENFDQDEFYFIFILNLRCDVLFPHIYVKQKGAPFGPPQENWYRDNVKFAQHLFYAYEY
jgi:hypothetical protein